MTLIVAIVAVARVMRYAVNPLESGVGLYSVMYSSATAPAPTETSKITIESDIIFPIAGCGARRARERIANPETRNRDRIGRGVNISSYPVGKQRKHLTRMDTNMEHERPRIRDFRSLNHKKIRAHSCSDIRVHSCEIVSCPLPPTPFVSSPRFLDCRRRGG